MLMPRRGAVQQRACTAPYDRIESLHVELSAHAVLLRRADGGELSDTATGTLFDSRYTARRPDLRGLAAWAEGTCAPLVLDGALLAAARVRLRMRAEALGFALGADPALTVLAGARTLAPDADGAYRIPPGTSRVRLRSRSFVPAWLDLADDARRLGVACGAAHLDGHRLPDSTYAAGWHRPEAAWRWTDGDATLRLDPQATARWLALPLAACGGRYWSEPASGGARH